MHTSYANLNVVLVEPSAMQARSVIKAFNDIGITNLRTADSAAAALQLMRTARPDVVVGALYLPDMSGTELVLAMHADEDLDGIPFILVSSETRADSLDSARQAGISAILPKPFSSAQLQQALDTSLDYLAAEQAMHVDFRAEELRVLLVDDSPNARKFMRRLLENLGVTNFLEADNGKIAVDILSSSMVDLVITDYNMPEMDGAALVTYIRQHSWQKSVPVLMVTSESNQSRLAAVEAAGVSGILDKPFEPMVVRKLLARVLANQGSAEDAGH